MGVGLLLPTRCPLNILGGIKCGIGRQEVCFQLTRITKANWTLGLQRGLVKKATFQHYVTDENKAFECLLEITSLFYSHDQVI